MVDVVDFLRGWRRSVLCEFVVENVDVDCDGGVGRVLREVSSNCDNINDAGFNTDIVVGTEDDDDDEGDENEDEDEDACDKVNCLVIKDEEEEEEEEEDNDLDRDEIEDFDKFSGGGCGRRCGGGGGGGGNVSVGMVCLDCVRLLVLVFAPSFVVHCAGR